MSFTASLTEIISTNANGLLGKHPTWERVSLGDIASILNGFAFPSAAFTRDKGVPLMRIRDITNDRTEAFYSDAYDPTYIVETGELVVGMDGDFNCALWKGKASLLNQRVCKLSVDANLYNLKFLAYALPGYLSEINKETSSITVKHLSSNTIAQIPLPLPPLREQERVVNKIEELFTKLDAGVRELRQAQVQLKRYWQSVLKAAVTGELTKQWREAHQGELEPASELLTHILKQRREKWEADELKKIKAAGKMLKNSMWKDRYKEPAGPEEKHRPSVPAQWSVASAEQLTSVITDGEHITPERSTSGILLLSARNVLNGRLSLERVDHVPERVFKVLSKRLTIEPGDVLLSCSGSVGRSCVAPDDLKFTLVRSVAVLKPFFYMGKFLSYALRSSRLQAQIQERKTQTAQANIFQGKIRKLVFPLPPLDEQDHIVDELEKCFSIADAMEQTIKQSLKQAERMRQSILKQAFEGKLVPQDPNNEPARLLLERIKIERAKREAEKSAAAKPNRARFRKKQNKRIQGAAA